MSRGSYSGVVVVLLAALVVAWSSPVAALTQTTYDLSRLGLGTELTVFVIFSDQCVPCTRSLPFYRQILAKPRMDGKQQRLVVIAPDGVIPAGQVLKTAGVTPHRLSSGPSPAGAPLPVRSVPALVIVDRAGKTIGTWEGPLDKAMEAAIIEVLDRATHVEGKAEVRRNIGAPWNR